MAKIVKNIQVPKFLSYRTLKFYFAPHSLFLHTPVNLFRLKIKNNKNYRSNINLTRQDGLRTHSYLYLWPGSSCLLLYSIFTVSCCCCTIISQVGINKIHLKSVWHLWSNRSYWHVHTFSWGFRWNIRTAWQEKQTRGGNSKVRNVQKVAVSVSLWVSELHCNFKWTLEKKNPKWIKT